MDPSWTSSVDPPDAYHRSMNRSRNPPEKSPICSSYVIMSRNLIRSNARRLYYSLLLLAVLGVPRVRLNPYVFVTVLKRWWGTTRYLYAAWCPTRAAVVLRPTAGWRRGPRGTVCRTLQPARPASSSRSVSWEARGPERSHRSGGLLGPAQVLCRLTPAGPRRGALLASEERERTCPRARAGGDTSLTENTPARDALAGTTRRAEPRRETRARGEKRRAHATTRDQHEDDSRDPSRGRVARASILAPEVKIIAIESTKDAASRGHDSAVTGENELSRFRSGCIIRSILDD